MTPAELLKPILGGGIRSVNFFNGRLLSGEDMSREQEANRETHKMLGRAMGDGIAYGFEVSRAAGSGTTAVVTVQPGLAINRNGETLRLSSPLDLSLVRPQNGSGTVADAGFSSCTPFQSGVYVSGSGVYLLTVCPARANEGRTAVSGLQNSAADCNTKYVVDGVQFRLIQLDLTASELNDQNHLRNLVAYKCFSIGEAAQFVKDPFGLPGSPNLIEGLRPNRLTDCDVPLAVLQWTASEGIKFVDMWSVRRRLAERAVTGRWDFATGERLRCEAEAMFLQFEEQVNALLQTRANPDRIRAVEEFRHLPPVGIIPLATNIFAQGFHGDLFFDTLTCHSEVFIEGARVHALVQEGLNYPSVDLEASDGPVMLWVYRVRENRQTVVSGTTTTAVQPCLVFSSGHMAYMGDPHFDVNRWDFSNYA